MSRPTATTRRSRLGVACLALLACGALGFGVPVELPPARTFVEDDAAVTRALSDELARSMGDLKLGDSPRPYFVSYAMSDAEQATVVAAFGAVTASYGYRGRMLRTDVRVGSPAFDNSNTSESMFGGNVDALPLDDDYPSLRRELWLRTDEAYKSAVEGLAKKSATAAGQASHADDVEVPDFSRDAAAKLTALDAGKDPDTDALQATVQALSAVLRAYPQIAVGRATAIHARVRRRFVSSEGGTSDERKSIVRIDVVAETQAPDGMRLVSFVPFVAPSPTGFPPLADMQRAVQRMAAELVAMTKAPLAASGTASVLFEGLAAAQIAKLLIADNLSGTPAPRTASGNDERGQSSDFSDRLGQKVASPLLMVEDDPSVDAVPAAGPTGAHAHIPIWGAYRVDDEGIPAARVSLIEAGILKGLLMTRTPRKEILHSNGHARATRFGAPHATLGALFVSGRNPAGAGAKLDGSRAGLSRGALLAEMIRASKAGGLSSYVVRLLDDPSVPGVSSVEDGFSMLSMGGSGRSAPSVKPLVVYRLRADGTEELVRGLTLEGLVPRSLRDIVAMGKEATVYNFQEGGAGFVGIPATIVTPALWFADVDVRRNVGKNRRPPLYPRPEL